jgi:hypothetical protein
MDQNGLEVKQNDSESMAKKSYRRWLLVGKEDARSVSQKCGGEFEPSISHQLPENRSKDSLPYAYLPILWRTSRGTEELQ